MDSNESPAAIDARMYRYKHKNSKGNFNSRKFSVSIVNILNFCKFIRAKVTDEEHGQYGWIHLRQSIHNPNIAVNVQSMVPGGCRSITKSLRDK